jgi:intein-encoded DNA endonuclease-like protein
VTKQQLKDLAKRYEECYNKQFDALPLWKRVAIEEDISTHKESGILQDFVASVIMTAETEVTNQPKKSAVNKITPKQYQEELTKRFL